jgi:hypothetical protein
VTELSRRSFAESLAMAALAPLIGVPPESIRLPLRTASESLAEHPGTLATALAEVIRTQYGSRLSSDDLITITSQIQAGLERVDQLRKVDLANGDEPDFVFAAPRLMPPAHD